MQQLLEIRNEQRVGRILAEPELIFKPLDHSKLPQTITCKICNQPSHLLALKPHIVFWIHQGKELEKCTYIAYKTSFYSQIREMVAKKSQHLAKQIVDGKQNGNSTSNNE